MSTVLEIPTRELPLWMRQARRGVDWGVLIVFAFSLTAAWSFILQPGLPRTNASENYVFRTDDYAAALQEGRLYPRWSPHVLGGYGAPVPSYYPPGAVYSAALVQVLFSNDPVTGVRIMYILSLCMAGSMVYAFVTRWAGAAAGILASLLYVYSPYVGLVAPHVLGDLPGTLTFALIPAFLWAVSRLIQLNRGLDVLLVSLTAAALLLTDLRACGVAALLGVLLMTGYFLLGNQRFAWRLALLACGMGVLLSSFYWLPALLEQSAVHWKPSSITPLPLKLQWPDLITPVRQIDLAELIPTPQLTLGAAVAAFALIGVLGLMLAVFFIARDAVRSQQILFQALFLLLGLILMAGGLIFFPGEIWLLGPMTLCLSVGGSAALILRELVPVNRLIALRIRTQRRISEALPLAVISYRFLVFAIHPKAWQRLLLVIPLMVVLILSLPVWLSPSSEDALVSVNSREQIGYEQQGYGVAILPPGLPLPVTISDTVSPNRFLLAGYQSGSITKITPDQLTADVQASVLGHNTHSDRFQLRTVRPVSLDILTAYFPGWQAALNGQPVPLQPNPQTGLIRVTVPMTQTGELYVSLGTTPVRELSWWISWGTLIALLVMTLLRFRHQSSYYDDLTLLTTGEARLVAVVFGCFIAVILGFATPQSPASLRARPGYLLEKSVLLASRTDAGLEALAYHLDQTQYRPGQVVDISLYWRALRFLPQNYQVQVYLRDQRERIAWLRTELRNPGAYPTRRWITNRYVSDPYHIMLSPSMVPGDYEIAVEVFTCKPACTPDTRLTFFDQSGVSLGQTLLLPTLITIRE